MCSASREACWSLAPRGSKEVSVAPAAGAASHADDPHRTQSSGEPHPDDRTGWVPTTPTRRHLRSYAVGNAGAWLLWGAIAISADRWYWWPLIPLAGWTATLVLYLWVTRRPQVAAVPMTRSEQARRRVRGAALLLIAGLVAGPLSTHVYWLFGGTWGLYDLSGAHEDVATTGVRALAALVIVLLVGAILVVLARAGLWRQEYLSDRLIRFFAWAVAAVFVLEALGGFTWSRGEPQWWLYAPIAVVLALLALLVAGSGGAWRIHRPHRMLPSH
jgi:hypothetical protein